MKWQAMVAGAMSDLAETRPVFHSEADFQHALAWRLGQEGCEIRLEVPWRADPPVPRIDLVVTHEGQRGAVELKYWKRKASIRHGDEQFDLTDQGAHDLSRYDFWHDVARVERLVDGGDFAFGCTIALTNDERYWKAGRSGGLDEAFRMHEDHPSRRAMAWARSGTGTSRGREAELQMARDHRCVWSDYSSPDGQRFRWAWVTVLGSASA